MARELYAIIDGLKYFYHAFPPYLIILSPMVVNNCQAKTQQ
jgi:hypothetical protein